MDPSQGANPPSRSRPAASRRTTALAGSGGVGIAVGAVAAVFVAQLLMRQVSWLLGLALSILAAIAFAAVVSHAERPRPLPMTDDQVSTVGTRARHATLGGFGVAAVLTIALYFLVDPSHIGTRIWLLHATTIAVLVAAAVVADRGIRSAAPAPTSPFDPQPIRGWLALTAIVAAGTWLRFRNLDGLPFGLWFDEADTGLLARRIVADQSFRPLFVGVTPTYHGYLISVVFAVFGESVTALRAVSAAFGVGTILAGYLVGRELFGRAAGLALAFLVVFSRWDLTLSRIGMNNVAIPFASLMALGLVLRGSRRRSTLDFVLAGLFAGAGVLFYSAMLASIVAIAMVALGMALRSPAQLRWAVPRLAAAALAALIVCTPLAKFAVDDPTTYLARNRTTAIWSPAANIGDGQQWNALKDNVVRYLAMTHYQGDRNGRHNLPGAPMLPPLVAGLAILGLGAAAVRAARPVGLVAGFWLPLALLPGVLSLPWEAPNSLRAVAVLPVSLILATTALAAMARIVGDSVTRLRLVAVLLVAGIGATGLVDVGTYFGRQADDFSVWAGHSANDTIAAGLIARAPLDTRVYASAFMRNRPTIDFLTDDRPINAFFRTDAQLPIAMPSDRDALLLTTPDGYNIADQALAIYPHAIIERYPSERSAELIAINIPAGDIAASLGWSVVDVGTTRISTATLVTDAFGLYRFRATDPSATVTIDGSPICTDEAGIGLFSGVHRIEVVTAPADDTPSPPAVEWTTPDDDSWQSIPADRLLEARFTDHGLLGIWHIDPDDRGSPSFERIDATVDLRFHEFPIARPYRAEWSAVLTVPVSGDYEFTIVTDVQASLTIGGVEVAALASRQGVASGRIDLEPGPIPLVVSMVDRDGTGQMRLRWKLPGDQPDQIVPSSTLSPMAEPVEPAECAG